MTTFLDNHCKIHELESRLSKNQYLSKQCLPNFADAQVFIALKSSHQIPKRQIYPQFYHWYVLMSQFADRTLDHWLRNDQNVHYNDHYISDIIELISKLNQHENSMDNRQTFQQGHKTIAKSNPKSDTECSEQKQGCNDSLQSLKEIQLTKTSSQTEKKHPIHDDSVTEYLMSIKLNVDKKTAFDNVKQIFQVLNVKIQSIKVSNQLSDHIRGLYVRVFFQTSLQVCEELKNQILRCSNVQTIQCKKHKRNLSL